MRIASSDVAMTSQHSYVETNTSMESLKVWNDKVNPVENQIDFSKLGIDTLEISDEAKYLQLSQSNGAHSLNGDDQSIMQLSESDKRKIELIEDLFKYFFGKKIKFIIPRKVEIRDPKIDLNTNPNNTNASQPQQPQKLGWGLIYNKSVSHHEVENTSFNAQAAITIEDGREINLDLQLNLNREFTSKSDISIRAGDALKVDPLVVNYSAASASVTQQKYQFDIDADGTLDQVSFAGPGSGFLTLDINNDGKINDGKELFGPNSGNGFSDLANYDSDKNGWIDENDPIYEKLRIWSKDEQGNDYLFALGEKGIGAIYLGNISSSFELNNSENQTNAQIQRTGIFLRENGTAGTIQHVDLVI